MNSIKLILINKMRLISSVMRKLCLPDNFQSFVNNFRHEFIMKQLYSYFAYIHSNITIDENSCKNSNIIWLFWWQGKNNMPKIVQRCINSVILKNPNRRIILITKFNINNYSNIPNYIYKKMYNNKINLAHFSDVLRFNLLRNYGGLWIDSTMLCTSSLSDKYFSYIYTSCGDNNYDNYFVCSKWTSFLIGGCKGNELFVFMDEFYKLYYKYNNRVIDYFLLDYCLKYAYKNNLGNFKVYVDNYAYKNNPHLNDLMHILNDTYDERKYLYLKKNTDLFKLSYKANINNNKDNFYRKIINNKI